MVFVFDIGGTNTRVGISSDSTTLHAQERFLTDPHDYDRSLEQLVSTVQKLAGTESITGGAGGVPGPLLHGRTTIGSAPNLPGWHGRALAKDLSERLHAPVFLENDTAMIGLAEAAVGAGRGYDIVVYLTVSTGVGGCRIVRGEIDANARGFEPGHHIVTLEKIPCVCGGYGHLESLIGGSAMEQRYGKKPADIDDPAIWDQAARHLAVGLHNLLVIWSPQIFVIGGPMMKDISIEKTTQYLHELVTLYQELPPIVPAALGSDGGLIGSLAALRSRGLNPHT